MKILIFIFVCLSAGTASAQEWQSISQTTTYEAAPINQFVIDPHKNDIWLVNPQQLAVFQNNGSVNVFHQTFSPYFLWGGDLYMAFTSSHVYYAHDDYGLYSFDNFNSQLEYNFSSNGDAFTHLSSNLDTINLCFYPPSFDPQYAFYKYSEFGSSTTNHFATRITSKNNFTYATYSYKDDIMYFTGTTSLDYVYLAGAPLGNNDPEYLGGQYNEMKFSRLTDTLYVGGKTGISLAYNYDFFDSITPTNTTNMPSPNVLEMEWDMDDNLWAVFGTSGDTAFAIAQLQNDTWINRFDASNSPINFDRFLGLEIDTLSNLWVADDHHLHTLLTANSPAWLSSLELDETAKFNLFPNPSNGTIHLETENKSVTSVHIYDLSGRKVQQHAFSESIQTHLSSGTYLLNLMNNESIVGQKRIVIR